ncbi:MAG: hypothetical protein VX874_05345 [Pseudomonadota bacterium]|nr:hypothetical protein [Pseudomonadota bacterium]
MNLNSIRLWPVPFCLTLLSACTAPEVSSDPGCLGITDHCVQPVDGPTSPFDLAEKAVNDYGQGLYRVQGYAIPDRVAPNDPDIILPTTGSGHFYGFTQIAIPHGNGSSDYLVGTSNMTARFNGPSFTIKGSNRDFAFIENLSDSDYAALMTDVSAASTAQEASVIVASHLGVREYADGVFGIASIVTSDPVNIAFAVNGAATVGTTVYELGGWAMGGLSDSNLTFLVVQGDTDEGLTLTRNGSSIDATMTMAHRGGYHPL